MSRSGRYPELGLGRRPDTRTREEEQDLEYRKPAPNKREELTPIEYCDEAQEEAPHISYFNRRSEPPVNPFRVNVEDGQEYPYSSRSPVKQRDSRMFESPSKRSACLSVTEETRVELPIDDKEFERRTMAAKLEFAKAGANGGSIYSQRPIESESTYHMRLYQAARARVRSSLRASMGEKRDVRFTDYHTVDTVPEESTVSPTDARRKFLPRILGGRNQ